MNIPPISQVYVTFKREGRGESGGCITMTEPTREMRREAATGELYDLAWGRHPLTLDGPLINISVHSFLYTSMLVPDTGRDNRCL